MANIGNALKDLWATLGLRLESLGVPKEVLPAILAVLVIGILLARRHQMKKNSNPITDETVSDSKHQEQGKDTTASARKVEGFCTAAHWDCSRSDDVVRVSFTGAGGTDQAVFLNSFPTVLEVVGLLPFSYTDMDEAPHDLSNTLMKLNAGRKSAFWAIYDIGGDHYYCLIDNLPIDRLSRDRVLSTVRIVRDGCTEMMSAIVEAATEG
jgi:hypothetical protein